MRFALVKPHGFPTFLHGKTTVFPTPFPKAKAFLRGLPPKGDKINFNLKTMSTMFLIFFSYYFLFNLFLMKAGNSKASSGSDSTFLINSSFLDSTSLTLSSSNCFFALSSSTLFCNSSKVGS